MTMNWIIKTSVFAVMSLTFTAPLAAQQTKPNIIWIISEDMGPDLRCWGVDVHTPDIDGLAKQGVRYTRVFGTASVCMPNRTAMITGVTQTTLGAVTMRPPQEFKRPLTGGVKPLPAVMRELGYFTANIKDKAIGSGGKDDWNFRYDGKTWDTSTLADLKEKQPFYAQFNFKMAHRPFKQDHEHPVDPAKVDLPPYYPDHPVARQSWSDYLESIQHLDRNVKRVLQWLETEQLDDNTIVFFLSDHGEAFLRGKYFLYDCSLNQPLIVRWPEACDPPAGFKPGTADDRMIAAIDITAQTVACGDGKVPEWMHGRAFLARGTEPREEIFSAADWYGGSKLKSRSVRTEKYKYIRNYNTSLSVNSASTEHRIAKHPMFHLVEILAERNELSPLHRTLLFDNLPEEELYDLTKDPHEIKNLADDPAMAEVKNELRGKHEKWIKDSGDLGFEEKHPDHITFFTKYKAANHRKFKATREATRADVLSRVGETANHRYISGVYPHLTTYTLREDEPFRDGDECGIGGIVPWGDKLYMINYGAHYPDGSTHSLYVVDKDLSMEIHPLSVGGTPAGRMIHRESEQLLIGPYLIDKRPPRCNGQARSLQRCRKASQATSALTIVFRTLSRSIGKPSANSRTQG